MLLWVSRRRVLEEKQRHPGYCLGCLYEIIVRKDALQSEANAEFVDHVATAAFVGRKEVEVDFGAGGKDEPAVLGADGKIEADAIHVVDGFANHEAWGGADVPAVLVVLVDVAEFEGKDDGTSLRTNFISIIETGVDVVTSDIKMAVEEE